MKTSANQAQNTGVVILAAGRSDRMGRPKLLLPWGDTTILGHQIAAWQRLGAGQIAVVCAEDAAMRAELDRIKFAVGNRIPNPQPEEGMFSSVRRAAQWPGWMPSLTHWVISLGDQPHLRPETLRKLLEFSAEHLAQICQPVVAGCPQHPVILPKAAFMGLAKSGAPTLREFLSGAQEGIAGCEIDDPGLGFDIDTPEDYQRMLGERRM